MRCAWVRPPSGRVLRARYLESEQHATGVAQVADDLAHRGRLTTDQRRGSDDAVLVSEVRLFAHVDDLDRGVVGEHRPQLLEVPDRGPRVERLPTHVQPQGERRWLR